MRQFSLLLTWLLAWSTYLPGIAQNCDCDHTITPDKIYINGETMNIQPGDVICIKAGKYKFLNLFNFSGTADKPLTFINCGGQVEIGGNQHYYGLLLNNVSYFRFTGTGSAGTPYGFKIDGINGSGSGLAGYGTHGEMDHLEIARTGFAGILYKNDPSCDPASWQSNFVMKNIAIHDNYIHDTKGEGIYVGYTGGEKTLNCNGKTMTVQPHNIEGLRIYNNRIENVGWDGLQVSRATKDCEIHHNTIENFGTAREKYQDEGILIGGATTGRVYNNTIIRGTGVGIQVFGSGNNYIYNNVIADVEADGIFCDDRETVPGRGFYFINNTIVNVGKAAMRMYSTESSGNVFYNNLMANTNQDVVLLNAPIDWKASHNTVVARVSNAGFTDPDSHDYTLKSESSSVDKGKEVSSFGIQTDHAGKARPAGGAFDIGAFELAATASSHEAPTVNAGADQSLTLPTNKTTLTAQAQDADGHIATYAWTQVSGPATASLSGTSTQKLTVSQLEEGTYIFQVQVTDNQDATAEDQVKVRVAAAPDQSDDAVSVDGQHGLNYAYYEGNWNRLPNFGHLDALKRGTVSNFSLAPRNTDTYYGFAYRGYIHIQRSGTYTFYTASDDGSVLYINGKKIVDNDGTHSRRERSGSVSLNEGMHQIEVLYFDKWGNNDILEVSYSGAGSSKQRIPDEALYLAKDQDEEGDDEEQDDDETPAPDASSGGHGISHPIMINFNEQARNNAPGWNNLNMAPTANQQLTRLQDSKKNSTDVSLKLLTSWNSSNHKGYDSKNNTGIYPDAVTRSYFYTTGQEEVLVSGLDPGQTYDFTFFASSWFGGNRTTEYRIGAKMTTLNASYNEDKVARLSHVRPDSQGAVTISIKKAPGARYAFLGALIIQPGGSAAKMAARRPQKPAQLLTEEKVSLAEAIPFRVTAYPIPMEQVLYLTADGYRELPAGIRVVAVDLQGRLTDLTPLLRHEGRHIVIDTHTLALPAGLWTLQCTLPDGQYSTLKVIRW